MKSLESVARRTEEAKIIYRWGADPASEIKMQDLLTGGGLVAVGTLLIATSLLQPESSFTARIRKLANEVLKP